MNVWSIETGYFKLDGGAMFGIVPKTMWQSWNPADEKNRCTWAMRSLLISMEDRLILIDTGCGNKLDFSHYDVHGDATLLSSIAALGITANDITDVVLTHLHFDHVGGATYLDTQNTIQATFPNARYWLSHTQWAWANAPQIREKASFIKENYMPLYDGNKLQLLSVDALPFGPKVILHEMHGHTRGMLVVEIQSDTQVIYFVTDLIPSKHHIPLAYTMSYDIEPLKAIDEKKHILERALRQDAILFFQHDPVCEACTLMMTDKGIRHKEVGTLDSFLNKPKKLSST